MGGLIVKYDLEGFRGGAVFTVFKVIPLNHEGTVAAVKPSIDPATGMGGQIVPKRRDHGTGSHRSGKAVISEFRVLAHAHGNKPVGADRNLIVKNSVKLEREGQIHHFQGIGTHLVAFFAAGVAVADRQSGPEASLRRSNANPVVNRAGFIG